MAADTPKYLKTLEGITVSEAYLEELKDLERGISSGLLVKDHRRKRTVEVQARERTFLVKIYKRERGLRALKAMVFGTKARRELRNNDELLRRGIPIVPLAAVKDQGGEHWVAAEKLTDWSQLQEVLLSDETRAPERRKLLFEYGRFARNVQDGGVWQYDFNPTNVLVRKGDFKLIDFEWIRMRRPPLARAVRLKLIAKMNRIPKLSRTDRMRFLKGYLADHPDESAGLKELARELLRLATAKEASDDDKETRRCLEENRDFGVFTFDGTRGHYRKPRQGGGDPGISMEDLRRLADGPQKDAKFRLIQEGDAISAWKEGCREARHGGVRPVAVVLRGNTSGGTLVYPR